MAGWDRTRWLVARQPDFPSRSLARATALSPPRHSPSCLPSLSLSLSPRTRSASLSLFPVLSSSLYSAARAPFLARSTRFLLHRPPRPLLAPRTTATGSVHTRVPSRSSPECRRMRRHRGPPLPLSLSPPPRSAASRARTRSAGARASENGRRVCFSPSTANSPPLNPLDSPRENLGSSARENLHGLSSIPSNRARSYFAPRNNFAEAE